MTRALIVMHLDDEPHLGAREVDDVLPNDGPQTPRAPDEIGRDDRCWLGRHAARDDLRAPHDVSRLIAFDPGQELLEVVLHLRRLLSVASGGVVFAPPH